MSDWEPTTEDIRNDFARDGKEYALKFDRWLFHLQEDAWDAGYVAGLSDGWADTPDATENPHQQGETE